MSRRGNWMQTSTGRPFWPLDPRPEDFDILDVAHALGNLCRFGGHCRSFYSVDQHSVIVANAILHHGRGTRALAFEGLLHDAAEAYIGDVIWPLKQEGELQGYKAIERGVERALAIRFGLPLEQSPIVKRFDLIALATEKRDLTCEGPSRTGGAKREASAALEKLGPWHCDDFEPLKDVIQPWDADVARRSFLFTFDELAPPQEAWR